MTDQLSNPVAADDSGTPELGADGEFVRRLCAFIESEVSQVDEPIEADTDLLLSGAVDSLGVVVVVEWIESTLSILIDPGDVVLEHFQTVGAIDRFLRAA